MPTLERAKVIQAYMGGNIYWDIKYTCFRVMSSDSRSLIGKDYYAGKDYDNYIKI